MTDEGYRPGTSGYVRVLIALFAAGVATFALLYSTQAILPELARQFDVDSASATLTVSLTTLGLAIALLVLGPVSDRHGRTRLIHLSLFASGIVSLAGAVAPTWGWLLGMRLLEGAVLAGLPAVATAYLREELDPATHARAAGLYVGGTALGGMVGRLLAGFVTEMVGWRWGLAAVGVLGLACAVTVRLILPASRHFVPIPAGTRALLGMARRAVSDRLLVMLYVIGGCSIGALVAVFNTLGFRLDGPPYGLGVAAVSLVYLVYPVGTLSSIFFGRLADKYGRRTAMPLGCAIAVAGALLTLVTSLPVIVVALAIFTAGFFAVHAVASGWVPARAHLSGAPTGQAASLYLFTYYLGSSVFGTLAGVAWHAAAWPGVVALATGLLVVVGVLSIFLRHTPSLLTGPRP